ncbi:MAG: sterol desaturase family protein, partial [Balneolaceae bacterium]|nr:sterol desaturase family protein [Balneolaceae bacterium]
MDALIVALENTQILALFGVLVLLFIWESFHPFYEHFVGKGKERGKHFFRNIVMGVLNAGMSAVVFAGLWLAASVWAEENQFGVLNWLDNYAGLPAWVHAVGAFLILDCWAYIWHRMNHEIPFFWRFHRVHHSDNKMDVTTA